MIPSDRIFPVSLHAAAKVNLFLRITGKRDDGYHTLESGVVFTAFGDRITIDHAAADEICVTGPFANILGEDDSTNICTTCCLYNACVFTKCVFRYSAICLHSELYIRIV